MNNLILAAVLALAGTAAAAQQGTPGTHFVENWDLNADGAVTLDEVRERRAMVFNMFDDDQDGMLNATEYDAFDATRAEDMAQNAGGHGPGAGRMNEGMLRAFNDANGDGMVSMEEFTARSADWFAMMDRTGDGTVTADDFGRGN